MNAEEPILAVTSAISALEASQPLLEQAGFQQLAFEDFYDTFVALIDRVITPDPAEGAMLSPQSLLEAFNTSEGESPSLPFFILSMIYSFHMIDYFRLSLPHALIFISVSVSDSDDFQSRSIKLDRRLPPPPHVRSNPDRPRVLRCLFVRPRAGRTNGSARVLRGFRRGYG